jgi:hypothetical protein
VRTAFRAGIRGSNRRAHPSESGRHQGSLSPKTFSRGVQVRVSDRRIELRKEPPTHHIPPQSAGAMLVPCRPAAPMALLLTSVYLSPAKQTTKLTQLSNPMFSSSATDTSSTSVLCAAPPAGRGGPLTHYREPRPNHQTGGLRACWRPGSLANTSDGSDADYLPARSRSLRTRGCSRAEGSNPHHIRIQRSHRLGSNFG